MAIVVDVWMKAAYIFDFTLHQTYAKLSGFLTNLAGLSVIIIGGMRLRTGALRLWPLWPWAFASLPGPL